MFEKKIPDPRQNGAQDTEGSEELLHDLSWAELAARLAAARDLRQELDLPAESGEASFDAQFARQINGQRNGKPGVNPMGLAHGKQDRGKTVGTEHATTTGNRGSE